MEGKCFNLEMKGMVKVMHLFVLMSVLRTGIVSAQTDGRVSMMTPRDTVAHSPVASDTISHGALEYKGTEYGGMEYGHKVDTSSISEQVRKMSDLTRLDKALIYRSPWRQTDWGMGRVRNTPYAVKPARMLIPASLFVLGMIGQENDWFQYQNKEIRDELQEHIKTKFPIDDYTQYAPMAATYGLNLCGIRGKHGYGDLTIILGTAYAIMGISVNGLKSTTRVMRPDGSSRNSFPSGHTATAFMGAELLRREYSDVSPWIGVAGYAVAAGTGFFRMYNNRHWLTDVVAGAGIGIMSVEAAYWLYPVISKTFFRKNYLKNTFISPYMSDGEKGVTCSINF